jgi:hypothetical protein
MDNFPHNNGRRHDTDERKNYAELNLTLDGRVWTAIKNNKKFIALCLLFGLNLINGVSVRDLTVMNRKEIGALQDRVKDYDVMEKRVAHCEEIQKKQIELIPLIERLTNLLKNSRPVFRRNSDRREFDEITTEILKRKPIGKADEVLANPRLRVEKISGGKN